MVTLVGLMSSLGPLLRRETNGLIDDLQVFIASQGTVEIKSRFSLLN